ncbi:MULTISPECIES: substrate-binding domain-containing protein [unclassified Pseudomonas]|uniref:molybdate ABC transporter substrate-binding protein n=1 Tax=unclassified Pseudomonas TaxID=196821 RepID=UPI0015A4D2B5|nr:MULTISPECIES: substrate-binding domain-containing protein [unclassified Pseudomonas]NWB43554.1 substrate-binding domain-containing protein [Pseudomonas sp. E6002]NWB60226.1 substrate-binding domain-containing protein [Pseudomonas sp. F1002]NWC05554.1 substrate-binding domain-containing protein [Pseudomonas sp. G1002]
MKLVQCRFSSGQRVPLLVQDGPEALLPKLVPFIYVQLRLRHRAYNTAAAHLRAIQAFYTYAKRRELDNATSLALSDTPSGTYLSRILFPQMHISERLRIKTRTISAKPVAEAVARGEAEIGFQQLSELMHMEGIDVIGLIPDQVQKMTMYSAAIITGSVQQEGAAELLKFLSSEAARSAMKLGGLTPVR